MTDNSPDEGPWTLFQDADHGVVVGRLSWEITSDGVGRHARFVLSR
jgi:hypothetical protein